MYQRRLTPFLAGILILHQLGFVFADNLHPAFLILNTSADINQATSLLEMQGAHISSRIPPSIVIADLPSGLGLKNLVGVNTMYQSAIPLSALQPLGMIATAAGMKWNRSFLSQAAGADVSSLGMMRTLVSEKSLAAPLNVSAVQDKSMVVLSWKAVSSALFYNVEAATRFGVCATRI